MSRALAGLADLPWGVHAVVAFALAAGIVIWLTGERFIKPMVITACATLGGVLGLLIAPLTPFGSGTGPGSFNATEHLLIGLGVGALLGLLMFRSAMALAFGLVLGALLPLSAAAILQTTEHDSSQTAEVSAEPLAWIRPAVFRAAASDSATASQPHSRLFPSDLGQHFLLAQADQSVREESHTLKGKLAESAAQLKTHIPEKLQPQMERVHTFVLNASKQARESWANWSARDRAIITLCLGLGLALGVIFGLSMPKWTAVVITAMFGCAIWIPSLVWLSNAMNAPWKTAFDRTHAQWLAIWAGTAAVGMFVQYSGILAKKPKPAPKPAAA